MSGTQQVARLTAGPLRAGERSLVPDVVRGVALLGIAVANSASHVHGVALGLDGRPVDSTAIDDAVNGVVSLLVDRRTLPAFALLFGYGFVVVLRRQEAAGAPFPTARALLLRRCLWLAVFGAAHIVLLWFGDILLTYALTGLALVPFLRRADRTLLRWAATLTGVTALGAAAAGVALAAFPGGDELPFSEETFLGDLTVRAITLFGVLVGSPLLAITILPSMLFGAWLARRRALEDPSAHLPLLRRIVTWGLAVSLAGGLPYALVVARLVEVGPLTTGLLSALHTTTGLAGGAATAALVALLLGRRGAAGSDGARGPLRALQAVGARSLTCYLAQSVLFVLPLAPWAGGLGVGLSSTRVVLWAVGVWLVTVALALALDAAGRTGPAEALLRRLVYRRAAEPAG